MSYSILGSAERAAGDSRQSDTYYTPDRSSGIRLAWLEESPSWLSLEVLPYLARRHEVTYLTTSHEIPDADFVRVIRGRPRRYLKMAAFELSGYVRRLYRDGLIDLAAVMSSLGFALRSVPFVNLETTSVYAQFRLFTAGAPWYQRLRFLPGFVHYAIPEVLSNRWAARVIAPSHALKRDILTLHHLPEHRVAVVPHGVFRRHLDLYTQKPERPARLLFVGRLHLPKGIAAVLNEFVRRRDIDAEFFIAGDGPDRLSMQKTAAGDARVKVLGHVGRTELEHLLATTHVFVFPTFYEACSLALLEAMASGHACVCYDIPAIREFLGEAGVLVRMGDAARLVNEIARLVEDTEAIAAYSARAHARARCFIWDDARVSIDRIIRQTFIEQRI